MTKNDFDDEQNMDCINDDGEQSGKSIRARNARALLRFLIWARGEAADALSDRRAVVLFEDCIAHFSTEYDLDTEHLSGPSEANMH